MHFQDVVKSPYFLQIAPFLVLFVFPALILFAATQLRRLSLNLNFLRSLSMGLESLGILPWLWSSSSSQSSHSSSHGRRHKRKSSGSGGSKSKSVRTRAEQIAMTNVGKRTQEDKSMTEYEYDEAQYYSGLVNISGTYCFMNSTLQALSSLTCLQPHIDSIHAKAEALDVPTPVIDALQELFHNLNTPKSSYHSLRPHGIIAALSNPSPNPSGFNRPAASSLFNSREHQDAQELFQLVSECIKNEMIAVDREGLRDRGMAGVLDFSRPSKSKEDEDELRGLTSKSVFDGLTANRRSCVMCGYTEAVMHFGFDNWQLAVPRLATSCRLEDCLEDYTRLEILKDCICRKCSVVATHKRLLQELKTLEEALAPTGPAPTPTPSSSSTFSPDSPVASSSAMPSSSGSPHKSKPSQSKKKRYKEVKKMEQRVKIALAEGRIEDEALFEGIRMEKVFSAASTKQAMIARPPPVLALHLNRSVHYGQYAAKNTIRVHFPEVLDLTPYTTSGSLSTIPTSSISTTPPPPNFYQTRSSAEVPSSGSSAVSGSGSDAASSQPRRSTTPTPETYAPGTQRTIYRLAAVVCHYGQHSFGHYICYRRKPRRIGGKWAPPTLVDPLRFETDEEDSDGEAEATPNGDAHPTPSSSQKKPNGKAPDYSTGPRYHWEDRTEEDAGRNRGWLRISDDSVAECGIESVLAEGSGAFMLYYERAVHPKPGIYLRGRGRGLSSEAKGKGSNGHANGMRRSRSASRKRREAEGNENTDGAETDGDAFSIGSEETLKPEMRVVDLHGSVGSLISEVGVGVMKTPKKDKEKERARAEKEKEREREKAREKEREKEKERAMSMSMQLPSSFSSASSSSSYTSSTKPFGPRVIRSVTAGRSRSTTPASSRISTDTNPTSSNQPKLVNGDAAHGHNHHPELEDGAEVPPEMVASAPSILASTSSKSSSSSHCSSSGLGSKSTLVMHHPPPSSIGVKAR